MASLKTKGDMAELLIAADLVNAANEWRFRSARCDWDIVFRRPPSRDLERVQVKYAESVYDATTDSIFYIPFAQLGAGRSRIHIRLIPCRNNQKLRVRMAEDYRVPTITATGL